MPQYHIDVSLDRDRWQTLDAFEQGYVEAAFWLIEEETAALTFADLADEALASMRADCKNFRGSAVRFLDAAYEAGYDEDRAGADFYLTRNRHGAGFWDRGLGATGDRLTSIAHTFGETALYVGDDGKLYVS